MDIKDDPPELIQKSGDEIGLEIVRMRELRVMPLKSDE